MVISLLLLIPSITAAFMGNDEIAVLQKTVSGWPVGDRIAFWAEQFIDTPYDRDPDGEYVTKQVIVADSNIDCMYHLFRSVELALGRDPDESVAIALERRFHTRGVIAEGRVANYEERYRYGEDMIDSGKWGEEITRTLGRTSGIKGSRGRDRVLIIFRKEVSRIINDLRNGDIIFFVKDPRKRRTDEIVGHIGIIKREGDAVYLVNASGVKNRGGRVKKTLFADYVSAMPFTGIRVSRMQ